MKCRLPIILSTTSPVLSAADTQLAVLASTSSSHKNRSLKQVGTTSSVAMVFPSLARRRFMLSFESSHLYRRRYRREQKLCKHILTGCYPSDTITLEPCVGNSFMPCALNNFTPHLEPYPVSIAAHQLARTEHP